MSWLPSMYLIDAARRTRTRASARKRLKRLMEGWVVWTKGGCSRYFPELGKYRLHPPFVQTTQPSINRFTRFLADARVRVRRAASIKYIEGNHDIRLANYVLDNARAAFGLKRANLPESWPVMSLPYLCRFDDLDVEYIAGYPSSHVWLSDRLKCIHGHRAQRRSNAYPY